MAHVRDNIEQTARPSRRTLSPRTRRAVLTAHIVVTVGLLGEVSGFLAVAVRAAASDDPAFAAAAYDLLAMFSLVFGIPLSLASLATGLTLGLGSKWGAALPVGDDQAGADRLRDPGRLPGPRAGVDAMRSGAGDAEARVIACASWDVLALLLATGLSVYKPGRRRNLVARVERRAGPGGTTRRS